MRRHLKWISLLLALTVLLSTGCGAAVPGIMDNGADRFAAGKSEESYFLPNSGALLDELIDKYSGAYYIPGNTRVDPDDTDPTDPPDPTDTPDVTDPTIPPDVTDPTVPPDDTQPEEDDVTTVATVGCWEDFLDVCYDTYSSTSQHVDFELVGGYTLDLSEDLQAAYTELQRRDPIHASAVGHWYWSDNGISYSLDIEYRIDVPTLIAMKDETPYLVSEAASRIDTTNKSDYEIILAVNDYLCDTVYYPPTEPYAPVTHTAYGALKNGVAVCEGYACAAKLLLNELGIRCDIEVGVCIGGGGHAWNLVELDGQWYQMDVTWNDGSNRLGYLLVDDAYMRKSRDWDASLYPACTVMYQH